MTDALLQAIGMILVPLTIPFFGILFLFFAFSWEDYENQRGRAYYSELHPGEPLPSDASFWYLMAIEEERRIKKESKRK